MDNFLNKGAIVPKYPPINWTAKKATAYGYEFTQDATSTTITGLTDRKAFIGNKIIPDNIDNKPVIRIGNYVFCNCIGLNSFTISSLVTNIGYAAFNSCTELTNIAIPGSVTSIGDYAFANCTRLTSITSNSPNYRVEEQKYLIRNSNNSLIAFAQKDAISAVIPSSVTSIENGTFGRCTELASITISSSVTSIGIGAFWDCSELTSINIAKPANSLAGAPWGAPNAIVNWDYKG